MDKNMNEVSCGYNLVVDGKKYYAPNDFGESFIYKDYEAFENNTTEIVYIPEYAFDEIEPAFSVNGIDFYDVSREDMFTKDDLEVICQEELDNLSDEDLDYIKNELEIDNTSTMAEYLFYELDWCYPQTQIMEMF